jgi:uncharacterized membrane protein YcaP (DUF421 family)
MDLVIRALAVYFGLLILFRLAGKRTLAQITTFDFILLLIIGDVVQPGLLDSDNSLFGGLTVILTIMGADIAMSLIKQRSKTIEKLVDGVPLIVVENGEIIKEHAEKARIDASDVMQEARKYHGLERLDQVKYAVLERSGGITIIPKETARSG